MKMQSVLFLWILVLAEDVFGDISSIQAKEDAKNLPTEAVKATQITSTVVKNAYECAQLKQRRRTKRRQTLQVQTIDLEFESQLF